MFNNHTQNQPGSATAYTPEQLLQFAALQQQQAAQQQAAQHAQLQLQQQAAVGHFPGLNFNTHHTQSNLNLGYAPSPHPQQPQHAHAGMQGGGQGGQGQQAINPIFFNQFLAQHQAQAQYPVVQNAHAQLEFQQSFQTNFEAIQRLQALTQQQQQVAQNNAMQTDENDFTAQLLAQQTALLSNSNAMDTSGAVHPQQPPQAQLVHPPTPQLNIQHKIQKSNNHRNQTGSSHQSKSPANNGHLSAGKSTVGAESMADSALGSNNSGSSSLGSEQQSGEKSPLKNQIQSPPTPAPTTEGINMTATKFPILAANPQVHVPCTAKCYHRCKLGLACPRHAHKHLEKLQRKQKAAAGEPVPPSGKCGERKPKDSSGRLKSIETITSGSCISNSGSSVLSALTGEKSKIDKNSKRTFLDLYEVYNVIGVGGGGMVYSGRRIADKLPVAIKRVMREKVKRWETVQGYQVPQEIALMLRCYGHPGVIRLVDWYECLDSFILIMERPERAVDLFDYIREVGRITEREAARIFKRIVDATIHIQKCGVVHRDIKDENIIINRDTGEAKLIDFGCGTLLRDTAYRDFSGTPEFYPPEWFTQREYYARTAAVWSLGVLLFDMLQGEIPFKQKEKIVENNPNYKHQLSPEAKHLVQWLMSSNPKERPSIMEISSHPWLVQNLSA